MRKIICEKAKDIRIDNNEILTVKYCIIETNPTDPAYGIAITTYDKFKILSDYAEVLDITKKLVEIQDIFMVLYNKDVTPITLYDVLDVLLNEFDFNTK